MPWPEPVVISTSSRPMLHAAMTVQLVGDELAQTDEALRSLSQVVHRQLRAFAPQHRCGGLDQALDRDARRIVVAADEIVFGKSAEARRRVRQPLGKARSEIECGAHDRFLSGRRSEPKARMAAMRGARGGKKEEARRGSHGDRREHTERRGGGSNRAPQGQAPGARRAKPHLIPLGGPPCVLRVLRVKPFSCLHQNRMTPRTGRFTDGARDLPWLLVTTIPCEADSVATIGSQCQWPRAPTWASGQWRNQSCK